MSVTIRVKRGTATQWAARTTALLSGEIGYDLTNKITKIGDGTTLWASLPSIGSSGGTNTGDITFDGVQIIGAGTASGDGYGLGTIELVPDGDITSDQYLIIDPTAPNHIHIRAGGQQDNSSAQVYLGGERNNIEVSDPYRTVKINTKPNGTENTYGNSNEASNTQFIHTSTADIIVGDTVRLYTGGATYVVTAVTQDSPSAGFITVVADGLSFITGEAYVFTRDQGYNNQWTFGNDAKIYFPNGSIVESPMNEGHLTIYASTSSTLNGGYVEIAGGAANSDNKTGGTVNIIGGGVNGYNGTGGNVVLETVSSGKILLSGNGGEFLNDMSNPDNQIATMGDIADANSYTDLAIAGLSDTVDNGYIPIGQKATAGGVASLGLDGYIPDTQISPDIARDSEIITSYNDLTDKPNIALGAVKWTANHYLLPGGENTRYLAGDIVWDGGSIFVANFDNESLPTTNTQYWTNIGSGNRLNIDGRDIPNILWDNILNKPALFDGDYGNLTNKPSIPADVSDLTDTTSILVPFDSPIFTGTVTTDDLIVNGDFTINGQNFAASATSIVIEDNMVQLAHENAANTVDLGIVVAYNDGTAKHAGIVRDVSDNKWKLFKGVTTEPSTTVDFSEGSFDDLQVAGFTASSITVGDVSNTEIQYLNGLTGGIQEQLDAKLSTDAAAIIYLGKIEAGLTYAPKSSPTFTGTVTLPENTSGANLINIPNSALSNSSITINGSAVSLGGSTTIDALPSQSGNDGKYLTTNGTLASWGTIELSSKLNTSDFTYSTISIPVYSTIAELPDASSNHGRWAHVHGEGAMYFAHGGSWVQSAVYPSQSGQSGKFLTTNGTTTSWAEVSGGGGTAGADIMNIMEAW